MPKKIPALIAAMLTAVLAACSATPQHPQQQHNTAPPAPPAFSLADGVQVCKDVAAWYPAASNAAGTGEQFSSVLEADETEAGNSPLGQALQTMDSDDQPGNYTWWMSGPGIPSDYSVVQGICASTYGVTLPSPG